MPAGGCVGTRQKARATEAITPPPTIARCTAPRLHERTEDALRRYVGLARKLGLSADYRMVIAADALTGAEELSVEIARSFPRAVFYLGKLVFEEPTWMERLLHNRTAENVQRRLQFLGLNSMVLPVRSRRRATA